MSGPVEFTQYQLEEALYHTVDIAGRCLLPFILLGETAQSMKDGLITGNGIEIGVKRPDLADSTVSTLTTLATTSDVNLGIRDFVADEQGFSWIYRGVPIKIQVIKRKYEFVKNPDFIWYLAEQYNIPNPFATYWKVRHIVQ